MITHFAISNFLQFKTLPFVATSDRAIVHAPERCENWDWVESVPEPFATLKLHAALLILIVHSHVLKSEYV